MLHAILLVARCIAAAHDRWRTQIARSRPLSAEIDTLRGRVERLRTENELLRTRLHRLPHRRRPRYRPWERLRILWHAARYGLSVRATARLFVLSAQTVVNWRRDLLSGAARLVKTKAPLNKLPDVVADLVHRLRREWPRWGTRRIAGILARLGLRASRTSVQRILRKPRHRARAARVVADRRGPLVAKRPNHMWIVDFTRVGGLLRSIRVGAVIDAFSRRVLALCVCAGEPSALFAVHLLRQALRDAGHVPTWLISDHGTQFTSALFTRFLRRHAIRRRFGAVGRTGSIALIERFWRSMKQEYARGLVLYLPMPAIERRLREYVQWANSERPHQGLEHRAPDEVYRDRRPRRIRDVAAGTLTVRLIAGDHRLPVLRFRAAA